MMIPHTDTKYLILIPLLQQRCGYAKDHGVASTAASRWVLRARTQYPWAIWTAPVNAIASALPVTDRTMPCSIVRDISRTGRPLVGLTILWPRLRVMCHTSEPFYSFLFHAYKISSLSLSPSPLPLMYCWRLFKNKNVFTCIFPNRVYTRICRSWNLKIILQSHGKLWEKKKSWNFVSFLAKIIR